ncbi:MAG TPA: hypothetical protein VMZ91_03855 [Candidatus Paceibacterota bacterium]|nr:hypothetical protein [Candidatus Paceibacterota bacterium]
MKKIIVILMIVFCLLIFVEFSYATEKPTSPGEFWNSLTTLDDSGVKISDLSAFVKQFYIKGIGEGIFFTATGIGYDFDEPALAKIRFYSSFILKNNKDIMKIMDDLYKDPANVKIKFDLMCKVAVTKLMGGDFKLQLEFGRAMGVLLEDF